MNLPVEESEDRRIFSRIASGDPKAFRSLVDAHAGPLVTYATRILGNQAEAEEIVQEVFVRVWQKAETYHGGARATTWLHSIAHNLAIDALRKRRKSGDADMDLAEGPSSERPLDLLEQKRRATSLSEALGQVPERQKMALLLRYEQGLKDSEIADVLGLSVDASESLLARARRTLKALLGTEQ
jgi:RNA polymerase sigma-70 factor, ECF subfamily